MKKIFIGGSILIIGFLSPLLIPLVLSTSWHDGLKAILSGLQAVGSWRYALKAGLVSDAPTELEKDRMYIKLLPEAIVSVLTFPLAWFGPLVWTLGWLLLIPVEMISKRVQRMMKEK